MSEKSEIKECLKIKRTSCFQYRVVKDEKGKFIRVEPDDCPDRLNCGIKCGEPRWGMNNFKKYSEEAEKNRQEKIKFQKVHTIYEKLEKYKKEKQFYCQGESVETRP